MQRPEGGAVTGDHAAYISGRRERDASVWDRIGISLSGVCMVHCLLLPVTLVTLSAWPFMEEVHAWLHPVFAVLLVPTTIAAGWHGWRLHGNRWVMLILALGLIVVLAAGILGHSVPGAFVETALTIMGSVLLMVGHWRNWHLGRARHMYDHERQPHRSQTLPQLAGEEVCID